jgi:O-antigen/teichoic acid export membrane protein
MEPNSLTFNTLKNSTYNFLGYVWPFIFAIFVTPLIVLGVGVVEYGTYIFINTLISLAGLLDLGIMTATTKFIVEHNSRNEKRELKEMLGSMNSVFFIIGILGFISILFIGKFGLNFFNLFEDQNAATTRMFIIGGMIFFFSSITSIFSAIPTAMQRFDLTNKIGVVILTLSNLSLLFLVLSGFRVTAMLVSQLIFSIISFFVLRYFSLKILPAGKFYFSFHLKYIIKSYKFGLATIIANISNAALTYLDRLIIPIFIGPASLTFYTLPGNLTSKVPGITNTLSGILFPITTSLSSMNDQERIRTAYVRSFRFLTILSAALMFSIIFLAKPILSYWLNPEFAEKSYEVLIILAVTNLILALSTPLSNFLLGLGRLKLLSITSLLMAGINVVLLFILLPKYGIVGAAFAYLFALIPVVFLFYKVEKDYIGLRNRRIYYFKIISQISLVALISFFINEYLLSLFIFNRISMVIVLGISVVIYIGIYRILGFFEDEDRRDMEHFAMAIYRKAYHYKVTILKKILFTIRKDKRPSSYPYLSGDTFRKFADLVHDESSRIDPSLVRQGDIIFVAAPMIEDFFKTIHPKIKNAYILITHNGDLNMHQDMAEFIDEKILHWFGQNISFTHEKVTPIPIGIENMYMHNYGKVPTFDRLRKSVLPKVEKKNKVLFGFKISTNVNKRQPAFSYLSNSPIADKINFYLIPSKYSKTLIKYKFVASPEGNGIDCHRTWEALYLDVIPIVTRSITMEHFQKIGLPIWIIDEWHQLDDYNVELLDGQYKKMMATFDRKLLHADYWLNMIMEKKNNESKT